MAAAVIEMLLAIVGMDSQSQGRRPRLKRADRGKVPISRTYYLTSRFTGGPPKDEPLKQFVPLVAFNFDSPLGQSTAATMNPGFAYVAVTWQIAAEAIIPLNREGGSGTGFRAQLPFFLDDLYPCPVWETASRR